MISSWNCGITGWKFSRLLKEWQVHTGLGREPQNIGSHKFYSRYWFLSWYGRAKVAIRPTVPRPCVPTYIIADSYVARWAAPSDLSIYPKNSRVLEIGRYQMLKILFWGMVGLKSLLGQLYLDLASPPILLQILTWDQGPHLAIFRLTLKIREFWR